MFITIRVMFECPRCREIFWREQVHAVPMRARRKSPAPEPSRVQARGRAASDGKRKRSVSPCFSEVRCTTACKHAKVMLSGPQLERRLSCAAGSAVHVQSLADPLQGPMVPWPRRFALHPSTRVRTEAPCCARADRPGESLPAPCASARFGIQYRVSVSHAVCILSLPCNSRA